MPWIFLVGFIIGLITGMMFDVKVLIRKEAPKEPELEDDEFEDPEDTMS